MYGDGAGHQGVAGVEEDDLVLLELEGGLEGGEGVDHLVLGVQHEAVAQAVRRPLACAAGEKRRLSAGGRRGRRLPVGGEGTGGDAAAEGSPGWARAMSRQPGQCRGGGMATALM